MTIRTERLPHNHITQAPDLRPNWNCEACLTIHPKHLTHEYAFRAIATMQKGW